MKNAHLTCDSLYIPLDYKLPFKLSWNNPPPLVSLDPVLTVAAGGAYSTFGRALVLGQLDGDDLPDLVVGAPGAATAGCVYIFFGKSFWYSRSFLVHLFW